MKATKLIAALALILFGITSANAQTATSRGDRAKIKQGIRSGQMTKAETVSVLKSERKVKKDVRAAKADGVVTPLERKEIRKDKRTADRKIRRVKHNRRNRN